MMDLKRFVNAPPLTPYAPRWDFTIANTLIEDINLEKLTDTILKKERSIKKIKLSYDDKGRVFDGQTGLGKNSTTSRSNSYNLLSWDTEETNKLKQKILENVLLYNQALDNPIPPELWIQCWVNVMRFGQRIKPHLHCVEPQTYLSGHFIVQCKKSSTVYISPANQINDPYEITYENSPGSMTIFPSYIPHYTTTHYSFTPRISIAFDVGLVKEKDHFIKLRGT